jgi:hypothetical protein
MDVRTSAWSGSSSTRRIIVIISLRPVTRGRVNASIRLSALSDGEKFIFVA